MKFLFSVTVLFFSCRCFAISTDTIPADNHLIEYTGRIDFTNPAAPVFSYSGVSIRASFGGTSIGMIMNDNGGQNYYNLILDGSLLTPVKITTGKKLYKIAEGLQDTIHEIELFKRTEETFGKTTFFGFVLDEGYTLAALSNQRTRLFEFIGNSITCGYGNEGLLGGTFGPTTENHYMTYAAITSRNFNARHLAVCKSGIGIYRNYDGPVQGNDDCMTNYYTRTFLYNENPKYSFEDKPDLVCIDLGTNDFSTNKGDSALFVHNYFRLIDTIQTRYTQPDILCLLGPMMGGSDLVKVRSYLKFIADSANSTGRGNVYFFEMSAQTGDLGIGIDYHPTVAQHKRNAMELTAFIHNLKKWKITPRVMNAGTLNGKHITVEFNTPIWDSLNTWSGFSIDNGNTLYTIDSTYRDNANKKLIHLLLHDGLIPGEQIRLNYTPGSVGSEDSVMLGKISGQPVLNGLTATTISKGVTNTSGTRVVLTCNKRLKKNSRINGLNFWTTKTELEIDSFSIAATQLTLYLNDTVMKEDTLYASYSGDSLWSEDDVRLGAFSNIIISNNSVYSGIPVLRMDSFKLYPNPNATGLFYYELKNADYTGKELLDVYSINGMLMYRQVLHETRGQIDLQGRYDPGIYFFRIISQGTVLIKPVIMD
ncbi:MAG: GDSL-type esterase/lipase family protein [Bacteroidales bacterium]